MLNDTSNSRGFFSMSRLGALFRSADWRTGDHSFSAARHSPLADTPAGPAAVARQAQESGVFEALGLSRGDPACVGIGRPGARADHALASITDWLSYLPRDGVRAMVKDGWHWTT